MDLDGDLSIAMLIKAFLPTAKASGHSMWAGASIITWPSASHKGKASASVETSPEIAGSWVNSVKCGQFT